MTPPQTGRLYLVGIGPGDPELMTCKAVRILEQTSSIDLQITAAMAS